MRKNFLIPFLLTLFIYSALSAQYYVRRDIDLPDIPGYITLKCDFHTHTVFSDGHVWPVTRIDEAWRDGLDAIAITDHIEYRPHKEDVTTGHNRSVEIAKKKADELGILLIKGSEITRKMPPGHLNAIFITDAEPLETEEWRDALQEAKNQGAFIFWNHPGWKGHQKDGIAKWYEEHSEIFIGDLMHGMEVVNTDEYYPEVHRWSIDKNLTMLGNSDIHTPIDMSYNFDKGEHRAVTLVFAKEKTQEAIKEALFSRRTAVYLGNFIYGKAEYLEPLFRNSIEIYFPDNYSDEKRFYVQIKNNSPVDFELVSSGDADGFTYPESTILYGGKTVPIQLRLKEDGSWDKGTLEYTVKNLVTEPEKGLEVSLELPE